MSAYLVTSIPKWTPSSIPTHTVLTSVAATHSSKLAKSLSSATARLATETLTENIQSLTWVVRGAQASLTVISAENVLATATDSSVQARATQAIFDATLNMKELVDEQNLYGYNLNVGANYFFLVVYGIITLYFLLMCTISRYHWFNITFLLGYGLEFVGFFGRIKSIHDVTNTNWYIMQFLPLTIAPAFIMAGIYFFLAQLTVVYGRQFSKLRPMWYSYLFILCDIASLLIQAAGASISSDTSNSQKMEHIGLDVVIGGVSFQLLAMTIFILLWLDFFRKVYFANNSDTATMNATFKNYLRMHWSTEKAYNFQRNVREPYYNSKFADIRSRKLMRYFPLYVSISLVLIYLRCVYRIVEFAVGFSGFIVNHEAFMMVFDAMMISLAGCIYLCFHPVWVFGRHNVLKRKHISKRKDVEEELKSNSETEMMKDFADPS